MKTIFFSERKITLSHEPLDGAKNILFDRGKVFDYVFFLIKSTQTKWINVYYKDINYLEQRFFSRYPMIEAGGGLVENDVGELLFIYRLGKWDLPKGKIEKGENIEEAAIREVIEECGLRPPILIEKYLGETFHIYESNETPFIKKTFWFKMKVADSQLLTPQKEEGISEAKWVSPSELKNVLSNTYKNILEVLKMAEILKI